jgi:hypothetical protein
MGDFPVKLLLPYNVLPLITRDSNALKPARMIRPPYNIGIYMESVFRTLAPAQSVLVHGFGLHIVFAECLARPEATETRSHNPPPPRFEFRLVSSLVPTP